MTIAPEEPGMRSSNGHGVPILPRLVSMVTAGALYLLLLDAAVETFRAASPLAWIVVSGVAAYAVASVFLWRRTGWSTRAAGSAMMLGVFLAASAWHPVGATNGVHLLGQPTSNVLITANIVGVALATWLLVRLTALGRWRWAAAGIASVGMIAFLWGLATGVSYRAFFRSDPLAPMGIRFASLVTFLFIPGALIALVVWPRLTSGPRPKRMALQATALALALVMSLGGAQGYTEAPQASLTPVDRCSPPSVNPTSLTLPDDLDVLANTVGRLTRLAPGRDLSGMDPVALSRASGNDPQVAARLVRELVRPEFYTGALRGPAGTWLARAGNSVDRALLLAALLRRGGHRVRFARGLLSEEQAAALIRSSIGESRSGQGELAGQIVELTDAHVLFVMDSLYGSRDHRSEVGRSLWERTAREAREHVWVQVQTAGGDRWTDIDPTPLAPGETPVRPVEVLEQLPEAMLWRVRLEVSVEGATGQPQGLLSITLPSAYLGGVPITLFNEFQGDKARPVLTIGDVAVRGSSFDHGLREDATSGSLAFDPFGRARRAVSQPSPTPTKSALTNHQVTAQWLTICVAGPGGERSARYRVFAGDAMEGLHTALGIGVITGQLPSLLPIGLLVTDARPSTVAAGARLLAAAPYAYAALRGVIKISTLDPPPLVYVDAPNVFVARAHPIKGPNGEAAGSVEDLDLTLKSFRIVRSPESPLSDYAHLDLIYQGVLDHIVERALLAEESDGRSVGALMEAAATQGIPLRTVRRTDDTAALGVTPAGMAYVRQALERGFLLLLPERRPSGWESRRLGWWEVLPHSGWTQDTDEEGRHSTAVEQPTTTGTSKAKTAAARKAYADRFLCGTLVLASFVAGVISLSPDIPGEMMDDIAREFSELINDNLDEFFTVCEKAPGVKPPRVTSKLPKFPRPQNWKLPPGPQKRRPYLPPGGRVGGRGPR